MTLQELFACITGPALYRMFRTVDRPSKAYQPNLLESFSDQIIKICSITFRLAAYSSPLIIYYCYRKGYISFHHPIPNASELNSLLRVLVVFATAYASTLVVRGLGRYYNQDYQKFVTFYSKVSKLPYEEFQKHKPALNSYDFDFHYWPIEYRWDNSKLADHKRPPEPLPFKSNETRFWPFSILSYVAMHTFGKRMMYPGTVGLLQSMMDPVLREGRTTLVEHYKGIRYKLKTHDGNVLDSMFVNNRNSTSNGNKLVICCEGNAGFYEIGLMSTPIAGGYSVLGWNHPGFGGSTGFPFPENEVNAIDTVMKFAIERLHFKPSNIIVFAWSIGGYAGSWAAMQYPEIRGLVLDATFDDVAELAVAKMPSSWKSLVLDAVQSYFNLNISDQLKYYFGPVRLIRRTKDEIINTDPDEPLKTNRANPLIVKLFKVRFPKLMKDKAVETAFVSWLHQDRKYYPYPVNQTNALNALKSCLEENGISYPINVGDGLEFNEKINIVFFLASKTLVDYNSTHCTNLPPDLFHEPWDVLKEITIQNKL